jgi:hypothetical protein
VPVFLLPQQSTIPKYQRIRKSQSIEITAESTLNPPVLLYNKITITQGRIRYANFAKSLTAYVFTKQNDKTQNATITDYVDVVDPEEDKDWNDGTAAAYAVPAGTSTNIRLYDYGYVAERYVYVRTYSPSSFRTTIYMSSDCETWTTLHDNYARGAISEFHVRKTFRCLRWWAKNDASSGQWTNLYSLEVFELDDYTMRSNKLKLVPELGKFSVLVVGQSGLYYVYEISEVKETVEEIEYLEVIE